MSEIIFEKIVNKTRKQHVCEWCGESIEPEERAFYFTGVYGGKITSKNYMHLECMEAWSKSSRGNEFDCLDDGRWEFRTLNRGKTFKESDYYKREIA